MTTTTKQHRYLDIAELLRTQIQSGEWKVGERLPSFVEMYREHGATTSTMQKVYDLLEKEELIERRSRSGVYVADFEQKPRRCGVLALVLPRFFDAAGILRYLENAYTMRLLRGVYAEAGDCGFQITMSTVEQLMASTHPVDGLLIQGDNRLVQECSALNKPMVSLISHPPKIPSIGIDDFASSKAIADYLCRKGHRRIAALLGSEGKDATYDLISPLRVQGYQAALVENGVKPSTEWHRKLSAYNGELGYADWGYSGMSRWLKEGWANLDCSALVAQNDGVAVGVIKALRHHGYRVPQDVSVVGFDNAGNDWHFDLELTTVQIPLEEIGSQAVTMLNEIINRPDVEVQTLKLPTKIIEGESTTNISTEA